MHQQDVVRRLVKLARVPSIASALTGILITMLVSSSRAQTPVSTVPDVPELVAALPDSVAITLSPDAHYVAVSGSGNIVLWDLAGWTRVYAADFSHPASSSLVGASFNPDGTRVVLRDKEPNGARVVDLKARSTIANADAISEDARIAVNQGKDERTPIEVAQLEAGKKTSLKGSNGERIAGLSARGETLITRQSFVHDHSSALGAGNLLLNVAGLAVAAATYVAPFVSTGAGVALQIDGGMTLATTELPDPTVSSASETVSAWDLSSGRKLLSIKNSRAGNPCALSSDGRFLFFENRDGSIDRYELANGKKLQLVKSVPNTVLAASLSLSHGRSLARTGLDGAVAVYDATTGGLLLQTPPADWDSWPVEYADFSSSGKLLLVHSPRHSKVWIWNLASRTLVTSTVARALTVAPDDSTIITISAADETPILSSLGGQ